jgi:Cu/Ag efflux protein CusF
MMKSRINGNLLVGGIAGAALTIALVGATAFADTAADQGAGTPMAGKSSTVHGSGTVTAIDKSARSVTVKTDAGETRSFQVPSDVKGFDKLKKGDKIDVEYTEAIAVAMMPPGTKLSASERTGAMKSGKASGTAGKEITLSAQIMSVDTVKNTITLKGPKGQVETVDVADPDNQAKLSSLKPGQVMQFTYTEAMAVSVTPVGK